MTEPANEGADQSSAIFEDKDFVTDVESPLESQRMDSRGAAKLAVTTDSEKDMTHAEKCQSKCQSVPFALREIMGTALTKIFWSGFFWQLFSFAAVGPTYWTFALASGFGDAFGVFLGNLVRIGMESLASASLASADTSAPSARKCAAIFATMFVTMLRIIFTPAPFPGTYNSLMDSLAVSIGAFSAGCAWQPMVNHCSSKMLNFNAAASLVGFVCGTFFFFGYALGKFLFLGRKKAGLETLRGVLRDVSLAVGVMGAAAFFVGTDVQFPDNWLQDVVGERSGNSIPLDCLKSGFSTFLGFVCVSFVLVFLLPAPYLWTTARFEV